MNAIKSLVAALDRSAAKLVSSQSPPCHLRLHERRSGEPSPISWACGAIGNVIIAQSTFEHGVCDSLFSDLRAG